MKKYNDKVKIANKLFVLGVMLQICVFSYLIYVIRNIYNKEVDIFSVIGFIYDIFNNIGFTTSLIIIELIVYLVLGITDRSYYIRKLKEEEYKDLLSRKLIHYSNRKYKFDIETKEIVMEGNNGKVSNYSMKLSETGDSWLWFHQSEGEGEEPIIKSFNFTHSYEEKRKYKIVVDPKELDKDKTFIRDIDKCIIYKDNEYKGRAEEYTEFNWYSGRKIMQNFFDGCKPYTVGNILVLMIRTALCLLS